jgi:hypothetical protein
MADENSFEARRVVQARALIGELRVCAGIAHLNLSEMTPEDAAVMSRVSDAIYSAILRLRARWPSAEGPV